MAAQADKVFCYHRAAVRLGDDMAAFSGVPRPASGAAGEASHDAFLDGGGDGSFLGHGDSPTGPFPDDSHSHESRGQARLKCGRCKDFLFTFCSLTPR